MYDGLVNEPVSEESETNQQNDGQKNNEEQNETENNDDPSCSDCAGLCIDDQCRHVEQLSAGARHTCAVVDGGDIACWGDNNGGQLGIDGGATARPAMVDGIGPAESVSAGWEHTCAVLNGGEVSCWGSRASGAGPEVVAGIGDATAVAAGYDHTCVIDGGEVLCWGENLLGQIGDGSTEEPDRDTVPTPTAVEISSAGDAPEFVGLGAGWFVSAAVDDTGTLWMWGDNEYAQLARPQSEFDFVDEPTSRDVTYEITSISAGWHHVCATTASNQVLCWGSNETSQLGRESTDEQSPTPAPVGELNGVSGVDAGWGGHSCAAADDGQYCWGDGEAGQIGDGTYGAGALAASPVRVIESQVSDLAVGFEHSCAVETDGQLHCWGSNHHGQLGVGSDVDQSAEPRRVE